ncbi:hypothetical protein Cpir12675_000210 [Ceratocystis pirilliformis]|uniref:lipoyl(octanoyl) transferase n=1 Tax=Ceratocystis pirilliformis TaxID=259994 RepID=A0ABR3ZPX2_9PEZI
MGVFIPAYLHSPGRLSQAFRQGPSIFLLQTSFWKNYSSASTRDGLSSKLLLSVKAQGSSLSSYTELSTMQESARSAFLAWKKNPDSGPPPQPIVFAFTPSPVFTLGRRMHEADISGSERAAIIADLQCSWPAHPTFNALKPQILPSTRGGLMTYHGPGQIVLWPTIDLHSPRHRHFGVRGYARLLENTTQNVLRNVCGIATELDEREPGVWIGANARDSRLRKIAAMGVHLRRHISGLGVAVNMDVPVTGSAERNPWARFVPCGIRDRAVTSVQMEMGERWNRGVFDTFPRKWAEEFARRLDLEIVEEVEV